MRHNSALQTVVEQVDELLERIKLASTYSLQEYRDIIARLCALRHDISDDDVNLKVHVRNVFAASCCITLSSAPSKPFACSKSIVLLMPLYHITSAMACSVRSIPLHISWMFFLGGRLAIYRVFSVSINLQISESLYEVVLHTEKSSDRAKSIARRFHKPNGNS